MRDEAAAALERGHALMELGRAKAALQEYGRGLTLEPSDPTLLASQARAYLAMGELKHALDFSQRAIAAAPEDEYGHRVRSIVLMRMKRFGEALKAAQMSVSMDPDAPLVVYQLFRAAHVAGAAQIARDAADRLLELAPELPQAKMAAGLSVLDRDPAKAERIFREALTNDPESVDAMKNLGVALLKQKKRSEAAEAFYAAAKLSPTDEGSRSHLDRSTTSKTGFAGLTIFLLVQLFTLPQRGAPPYAVALVGLLIIGIIAYFVKRWLSATDLQLSPELENYVRAERWGDLKARTRGSLIAIVVVVTVCLILYYAMTWLGEKIG